MSGSLQAGKPRTELTISQLAERTGVPIATIKFYIREGLLPRPQVRTRTKGCYDESYVARLETIRELRSRRRLSVREIGALLRELGDGASLTEVEMRLAVRERLDAAIDPTHALPPVTAEHLRQRSGLTQEDIEGLVRRGLLTPIQLEGAVVFAERDARIAEVVGGLRHSGYQDRLGFTVADLARYAEVLRPLVVREVEQFDNPALQELPRDERLRLIEQGLTHIDVLLGLLHKKLLLAAVHDRLDVLPKSKEGRPRRR